MAKQILIKPLITEKATNLSDNSNQYTFIVDKRANKIEIRNAVESMYNVPVLAVNTAILPGRFVSRNTRSGIVRGRKSAYKKAIITLPAGEEIDLYGEI